MTKKHFTAIANILLTNALAARTLEERERIVILARDLGDYFATVNPRFDEDRFLAAAGEED